MKMPTLEQFRSNRDVLFWSLHAAFWAAYGITQYVGDFFYAYGSSSSWGTLLVEMTSLQTWPATRAVPIAFGLEMLLPAALDPALTRAVPPHPAAFGAALALACAGAALLGGSRAVAQAARPLTET